MPSRRSSAKLRKEFGSRSGGCTPTSRPTAKKPTQKLKAELTRRFKKIFTTQTGFATLDRLLSRLHAQQDQLLAVLERPDIPLHTNGSENDIRCQVTRRKISGGTRSNIGRDCRDAFLGLMKTCAKQGIRFWDYLGARLGVLGAADVPPLAELVAQPAPP
jgi:Transposase IS66 family